MIGGMIGGFVGGTFNTICQMPFIPGAILAIAIFLVWKCFNGDCWFENCRAVHDDTPRPSPKQPKPTKKSKELYTKIDEIVQKNLGMSVKDLVFSNA